MRFGLASSAATPHPRRTRSGHRNAGRPRRVASASMSSITAPSVPAPSSSRRRRLLLPIVLLIGVLVICSLGAGAAVYRAQQADLAAAQRDRAAALHTLDTALAR